MYNSRYIVARPGSLPGACRSGLRSCERYAPYASRQFSGYVPVHPFQRSVAPSFSNEIGSLWRLMDDLSRTGLNDIFGSRSSAPAEVFTPRFDIQETDSTYELRGELAGVDPANVSIEFTDAQTLVIKGRTERESTAGQLPEASTTNAQALTDASEQAAEDHASDNASVVSDSSYQRPSVADVDGEGNEVATPTSTVSAVAAADAAQQQKPEAPAQNYLVSERSVGEFSRKFYFPARADPDAVTASLKNGILNVSVPKAKAPEARKINIQAA